MDNTISKVKDIITSIIIRIFNCFPIKNNKIFLYSYYGSQYGCSPKYISEYLVKNYPDKYDVVWAFNDVDSKKDIKGIRMVRIMSLKYFYELCTSKVIITNFRTTEMFKKRKNQYYIQTWHSSLRLKQIEKDAEELLPKNYLKMAKIDSKKIDLLLSGCKYSTEIFKRAFWYDGEIFEHGTPANDILFENNISKKNIILKKLNVSNEYKFILYAPTFRESKSLDIYDMNYERIITTFEKRFGGKWMLLLKLHPHMIQVAKDMKKTKGVINVTSYDDIQELLLVADALISDYSAVMFSFLLTRKPCFLYVPDLEEYINKDRKLYFSINELPFDTGKNNDELEGSILNFNSNEYKDKVESMIQKIGSYEDGNASKNLVEKIETIVYGGI